MDLWKGFLPLPIILEWKIRFACKGPNFYILPETCANADFSFLSLNIGGTKMPNKIIADYLRLNYLYVDKYRFPAVWGYPRNTIPYSILRLIKKGRALFIIDNKEIEVKQDQIVYIPRGSELECKALEDDFTFISVRFTTTIPVDNVEIWSTGLGIKQVINCEDSIIHSYFDELVNIRMTDTLGKNLRLRAYLDLIMAYIIDFSRNISEEDQIEINKAYTKKCQLNCKTKEDIILRNNRPEIKMDVRVQTVIEYMIKHQYERIDLNQMSEMIEVSSSSLRRLFKRHTGKSPGEYIKDMKMMSVARRLLETNDRISQIAYDHGYNDPNYFSRQFKDNFGVSPQYYRNSSRYEVK